MPKGKRRKRARPPSSSAQGGRHAAEGGDSLGGTGKKPGKAPGRKKSKKRKQGKGSRAHAAPEGIFASSGEKRPVSGSSILDEIEAVKKKEAKSLEAFPAPEAPSAEPVATWGNKSSLEGSDPEEIEEVQDDLFDIFEKTASANAGKVEDDDGEKGDNGDREDEDDDDDDEDEGIDFNDALVRNPGAGPDDEDEDEDEDDDQNGAKGEAGEELINVEFEFSDPRESDYHQLCTLLRSWLRVDEEKHLQGWATANRNLADIIAKQAAVGTMIKAENTGDAPNDNPPLAFVTTVNINTHKKEKAIKFLGNFLAEKAKNLNNDSSSSSSSSSSKKGKRKNSKNVAEELQRLYNEGKSGKRQVALLIQERLINLPPALVPVMYGELQKDLEWARKNEETGALRNSFKLKDLIYLTRAYYETSDSKTDSTNEAQRKFFRFEDEVFESISTLTLAFPLQLKTDKSQGLDLLRQEQIVMIIPASKLVEATARMGMLLAS